MVVRKISFHQRTLLTEGSGIGPPPLSFRGCRKRPNGRCRGGMGIEARVRMLFDRQVGIPDPQLRMGKDRGRGAKLRASEEGRDRKVKTTEYRPALKMDIRPHGQFTEDVHGLLDNHFPPCFLLFLRFSVYLMTPLSKYLSLLLSLALLPLVLHVVTPHHTLHDGLYTLYFVIIKCCTVQVYLAEKSNSRASRIQPSVLIRGAGLTSVILGPGRSEW